MTLDTSQNLTEVLTVSDKPYVYGPSFSEMRDPSRMPGELRERALAARTDAPMDPVRLYDITWKGGDGNVAHLRVPPELTGGMPSTSYPR